MGIGEILSLPATLTQTASSIAGDTSHKTPSQQIGESEQSGINQYGLNKAINTMSDLTSRFTNHSANFRLPLSLVCFSSFNFDAQGDQQTNATNQQNTQIEQETEGDKNKRRKELEKEIEENKKQQAYANNYDRALGRSAIKIAGFGGVGAGLAAAHAFSPGLQKVTKAVGDFYNKNRAGIGGALTTAGVLGAGALLHETYRQHRAKKAAEEEGRKLEKELKSLNASVKGFNIPGTLICDFSTSNEDKKVRREYHKSLNRGGSHALKTIAGIGLVAGALAAGHGVFKHIKEGEAATKAGEAATKAGSKPLNIADPRDALKADAGYKKILEADPHGKIDLNNMEKSMNNNRAWDKYKKAYEDNFMNKAKASGKYADYFASNSPVTKAKSFLDGVDNNKLLAVGGAAAGIGVGAAALKGRRRN